MVEGTIKWTNSTKEFGFLKPDDGSRDVFVRLSSNTGSQNMTGIHNEESFPKDEGDEAVPGSPIVLVVDDDPDVGEATAANFRRAGLRVRTALTADNALDCCKTQPFDATVLDHHPFDGYSETLLDQEPDMGLAVIVSAPAASPLAVIRSRHAERVFAVLPTPVVPSELVEVVQEAVAASHPPRTG